MTMPTALSPKSLYGLTIDNPFNISKIVPGLKALSRRPTTRVVFDEGEPASDYSQLLAALTQNTYVMGELLDSYYVNTFTVAEYKQRTTEYLSTLGHLVDIWEVGNEINGEWLGKTADVVAKVYDAYQQVVAAGHQTALTLYYNKDCWSKPSNEMFGWTTSNILPLGMKPNYVLVSYYEADCNFLDPGVNGWIQIFTKLSKMFPNSYVGFGEMGPRRRATQTSKVLYLNKYYKNFKAIRDAVPQFVGGGFYWYAYEDMFPYVAPGNLVWQGFNSAIQTY